MVICDRDPRARRLAEREARAPAAPIPEQLSFKEKMKMFALESGDAATPKDKVTWPPTLPTLPTLPTYRLYSLHPTDTNAEFASGALVLQP